MSSSKYAENIETTHRDKKNITQLSKTPRSKLVSQTSHALCAHVHMHAVCTDKRGKVEEKETTQLKLLEGEGRANPWLSTLLSLQTSEPFANAPLHFYFALPFRWHTKMLVFPPESVTDRL